jgi:hypothetical protein
VISQAVQGDTLIGGDNCKERPCRDQTDSTRSNSSPGQLLACVTPIYHSGFSVRSHMEGDRVLFQAIRLNLSSSWLSR